ncbi:MAG: amidohydrolase [Ruminococcaceae bacterium]|nr:amidohydrolase [Oscillospiraceae bacterium]
MTECIKRYPLPEDVGYARQRTEMEKLGIYKAAGSVITKTEADELTKLRRENEVMYRIYEEHGDFFIPGLRVNPLYMRESCEMVEEAHQKGVRLIGELTPYTSGGWKYCDCGEIFDLAQEKGMVVNCHPTDLEDMARVCELFPRLPIVFAHPGEHDSLLAHIRRMKKYANAFLDISGTGLYRNGMLRYAIQNVGADRILFGSDYPICNPGMYTGGVLFENLPADDLEKVAYKNAERLLGR